MILLRAEIGGRKIFLPLEREFKCLPRIGERIMLSSQLEFGCTVKMVSQYVEDGFWYPGNILRRNGIKCKCGVTVYIPVVFDVVLDDDVYVPHDVETWHEQSGWDFAEWFDDEFISGLCAAERKSR